MRFSILHTPKKPGIGIDQLWPLIVLSGFAFYTSLVPQPPNDLWWHLKIGELIMETGTLPATNIFGWTLPETAPFIYGAWLGEYLLYVLYSWGGLSLLLSTRTLLTVVTVGLVGYEAKRRSGSWRLASIAIVFVAPMILNNLILRPQIWSWIPFMGVYLVLSHYVDRKISKYWLLICPVFMSFWVNAHGAFVLAIVLLGIFLVGEGIRSYLKWPGALTWREVQWIGLIGLLTFLATSINPQFVQIYTYVLDLMTDPPSQGLIVEWQSPTPEGIANITFFVGILVIFLVIAYARYRPTPTEALLLSGFLWLAWSGQRYVIWFALISAPVLVKAIGLLVPPRYLFAPAAKNGLNLILALLVWIPVGLAQPWFVEQLPLPETYWEMVLRDNDVGPLLSVENPVAAVDYLQEHPGGYLFNEMGYGSYLIWALPDQGVFIDPRVELYPYNQWMDYIHISNGIRYNELLARYGVDRLLISLEKQEILAGLLEEDSNWQREYSDSYAQIWIKEGTVLQR